MGVQYYAYMKALTETQQRLYDYLREQILVRHLPPTRAEISAHFGWKSPNAAEDHLRALETKGFVKLPPRGVRSARNIQIQEIGSCP